LTAVGILCPSALLPPLTLTSLASGVPGVPIDLLLHLQCLFTGGFGFESFPLRKFRDFPSGNPIGV